MDVRSRLYPEVGAGGFTRVDGAVEFYGRVNALLSSASVVVDFGAGRGRGAEDEVEYRRTLRVLKGKVKEVIGVDVDPAVRDNPIVDRSIVVQQGENVPIDAGTVDLVVSDYTLEHVTDPRWFASEVDRILKPGGWLCARTPNKWGLVAVPSRLVPNTLHNRVLHIVQPQKKEIDTFPTAYQLNTKRRVAELFSSDRYSDFSYGFDSEPGYAANSLVAWKVSRVVQRFLPGRFASMLLIFVQKR